MTLPWQLAGTRDPGGWQYAGNFSAPGGVEWSLDLSRTHVVRRRAWVRSYEMRRDSEAEGAGGQSASFAPKVIFRQKSLPDAKVGKSAGK